MKKVLFITALLFLFIAQTFCQERVNRKKLVFANVSEVMTAATGWAYNSTLGEWIDYKNVISNDKRYKGEYNSLQGYYMMSHVNQNFITIQVKTVIYKDIKYYVVVVQKWSGAYEYPEIYEDWYTFKRITGYIFTEKEYNKLKDINDKVELKTKYIVSVNERYEKYNDIMFLDLIQTALVSEQSAYSSEYIFPIMKSTEGTIRFYLPDDFSPYKKYDFEEQYFETDYTNFSKLIIK
jgi:hypothetical protein